MVSAWLIEAEFTRLPWLTVSATVIVLLGKTILNVRNHLIVCAIGAQKDCETNSREIKPAVDPNDPPDTFTVLVSFAGIPKLLCIVRMFVPTGHVRAGEGVVGAFEAYNGPECIEPSNMARSPIRTF